MAERVLIFERQGFQVRRSRPARRAGRGNYNTGIIIIEVNFGLLTPAWKPRHLNIHQLSGRIPAPR
jgi:hypothetical protein